MTWSTSSPRPWTPAKQTTRVGQQGPQAGALPGGLVATQACRAAAAVTALGHHCLHAGQMTPRRWPPLPRPRPPTHRHHSPHPPVLCPPSPALAVVTGVQIHSWGAQSDDDSPNLEFVAPTSVYCVVNGETAHLDIAAMPVGTRPRPRPARPRRARGATQSMGPARVPGCSRARSVTAGAAWPSEHIVFRPLLAPAPPPATPPCGPPSWHPLSPLPLSTPAAVAHPPPAGPAGTRRRARALGCAGSRGEGGVQPGRAGHPARAGPALPLQLPGDEEAPAGARRHVSRPALARLLRMSLACSSNLWASCVQAAGDECGRD